MGDNNDDIIDESESGKPGGANSHDRPNVWEQREQRKLRKAAAETATRSADSNHAWELRRQRKAVAATGHPRNDNTTSNATKQKGLGRQRMETASARTVDQQEETKEEVASAMEETTPRAYHRHRENYKTRKSAAAGNSRENRSIQDTSAATAINRSYFEANPTMVSNSQVPGATMVSGLAVGANAPSVVEAREHNISLQRGHEEEEYLIEAELVTNNDKGDANDRFAVAEVVEDRPQHRRRYLVIAITIIAALIIVIAVLLAPTNPPPPTPAPTDPHTPAPTDPPSNYNTPESPADSPSAAPGQNNPSGLAQFSNREELNRALVDRSYLDPFSIVSLTYGYPIGTWDVSAITNFSLLFYNNRFFNEDIGGWDMSSAIDLSYMFMYDRAFNQDIGGWNVSRVITMRAMFRDDGAFNHDINRWDTSRVQDMSETFYGAVAFNQNIGGWNVSSVISMNGMFMGAGAFNSDISSWDVNSVRDMTSMFYYASAFNQSLCSWGLHMASLSNVEVQSMFVQSACPEAELESSAPNLNSYPISPICHMCYS